MKKIPLQKGLFSIVDDVDYEKLIQYKWYATRGKGKDTFYAKRWIWIPKKRNNKFISMHRQILEVPSLQQVDHINHDTLDNRRLNLRICNNQENQRNEKISKNNTSGFKGVSWRKDKQKWRGYITINRKQIFLGNFISKENAAKAYNEAATKHFKEFALINNIPTL